LAKAGLLGGHEIATSPELGREILELCPSARPNSHDAACNAGKLLSARASALGLDLGCEIVARYFGNKLASGLSAALGIDWSGELGALDIVPGPLLVK
jgi:transcriptional regulator GlxA family with amidase domain